MELKATQESDTALFSSSSPSQGKCLSRFVSRRIAESLHQHLETEQSDNCGGKFLSRSGALLNQRLKAQPKTDVSVNYVDQIGECSGRVNTGSQVGATYIGQQGTPLDSVPRLHQQLNSDAVFADNDFSGVLKAADNDSRIVQNQWSAMESENKVQKAPTSVKPHKTSSTRGKRISIGQEQILMNGTAESVKDRTSLTKSTDRIKHCVKSKPPRTVAELSLGETKAATRSHNCLSSHAGDSHCDCDSDECTNEEKVALIPKSPPFNSLEEIGHSVGELLTNNLPKNSTCPPPLFLSRTTTTLANTNSVDGSMAANAETKYGSISYSDVNIDASKGDQFSGTNKHNDSIFNHQLPDKTLKKAANKVAVAEKPLNDKLQNSDLNITLSAPEVPKSCVNKLAADCRISREEASNQLSDKEELDGGTEDQSQNIECQWAAAKKKRKKSKKKKTSGKCLLRRN